MMLDIEQWTLITVISILAVTHIVTTYILCRRGK